MIDAITEMCADEGVEMTGSLDGTLTSFERVEERLRPAIIAGLRSRRLDQLVAPMGFIHAIRM